MMAVIAPSLPEFIILRKVLKPRLIAVVICVVGAGIIMVGYMFQYPSYPEDYGKRNRNLFLKISNNLKGKEYV